MFRFVIVIVLVLSSFMFVSKSYSCVCSNWLEGVSKKLNSSPVYPEHWDGLKNDYSIQDTLNRYIIGKVITVEYQTYNYYEDQPDLEPFITGRLVAKIKIKDSYNYSRPDTAIIYTGTFAGDCGFPFEVGKKYFVTASDYMEGSSNILYTNICYATAVKRRASNYFKLCKFYFAANSRKRLKILEQFEAEMPKRGRRR